MKPFRHLGVLTLLAFLFFPLLASAQSGIVEHPDGRISAEVDSRIQECMSAQDKPKWCWASCIQAVLRYYGCNRSQRIIAERILGNHDDKAVNAQQMVDGLNDWDLKEYRVLASLDSPINMRLITSAMEQGHPLIVGLDSRSENHAFVLVGMTFRKDERQHDKITPLHVQLLDPASSKQSVVSLPWRQFFRRVGMVLRIDVKPRSLQ